jgi:HEAT repeat protein
MFSPHRSLAALVLLASVAVAQDAAMPKGPSPEEIKAAAAACKEGLKAKEPADRIAAVQAAAKVDANAVADEISPAMKDKDETVAAAAMKALGGMSCDESLKELHRVVKNADKKLQDNAKLYATLLRSVGQHGDKSSVDVLAEDVTKNLDAEVVRARVYGLGNIRDRSAVEKLMDLTNLGNPTPGEDSPFMPDVRVALARLTGTDQTTNKSRWQEWWNKNKKDFKVAEKPPELPPELQRQWDEYWAGTGIKPAEKKSEGGGDSGGPKKG